MTFKPLILCLVTSVSLLVVGCSPLESTTKKTKAINVTITDKLVTLTTDNGRAVPARILTPEGCKACPLIIFSHGANAAYDRYDALTLPLAKAGYRVAVPNHTDSEEHPDRAGYTPPDWLPTRIEDYNVIASTYDTNYRIAAGHSFGALIAQIAGGTEISSSVQVEKAFQPNAVLAYSPPGPIPNYIGPEGWSKIKVPSLVTTGTNDVVPMMAEQWELHLASFEAAPPKQSVALIYEDMDHYMNGAYGRESETTSPEREQALTHMIEATIFFITELQKNSSLPYEDWATQERSFVEARSK